MNTKLKELLLLQVSLGVMLKNENKKRKMIEIMEKLQEYVPTKKLTTVDGEEVAVHPISIVWR